MAWGLNNNNGSRAPGSAATTFMPRDNPKRLTRKKLLSFTSNQWDCQQASEALARHERSVKALRRSGLDYDPESGKITKTPPRPLPAPKKGIVEADRRTDE